MSDEGGALHRRKRQTPYADGETARVLRGDMDQLPGVPGAQRRLIRHDYRIYAAFNSLEIFDHEAAREYLEAQIRAIRLPEDQRGKLLGMLLAFGLTCVEADREQQGRGGLILPS